MMILNVENHTTTNLKLEMLSGTKTGNRFPHDEEMYAALLMGMHKKDDAFLQRCLMH